METEPLIHVRRENRALERAGTEIYALPQYKLTYDENGYCVKKEKCRIPDDIAAKLAEMNK